jgi:hypothetical protein
MPTCGLRVSNPAAQSDFLLCGDRSFQHCVGIGSCRGCDTRFLQAAAVAGVQLQALAEHERSAHVVQPWCGVARGANAVLVRESLRVIRVEQSAADSEPLWQAQLVRDTEALLVDAVAQRCSAIAETWKVERDGAFTQNDGLARDAALAAEITA